MVSVKKIILAMPVLAGGALARTDLSGCVSTVDGATLEWYVPGTGEICTILDCGGGRAPPKSNVPGCPLYTGTGTVPTSYLPGFPSGTAAPMTGMAASATSTWIPPVTTGNPYSAFGSISGQDDVNVTVSGTAPMFVSSPATGTGTASGSPSVASDVSDVAASVATGAVSGVASGGAAVSGVASGAAVSALTSAVSAGAITHGPSGSAVSNSTSSAKVTSSQGGANRAMATLFGISIVSLLASLVVL
jgi:hypothetical protein